MRLFEGWSQSPANNLRGQAYKMDWRRYHQTMAKKTLLTLLLLLLPVLAAAQLQQILGNKRPPPFVHPQGFYAVTFPRGWDHELKPNGQMVDTATKGDQALFTVTMESVPGDVDTEMVALNAGRKLRELPHYKDGGGGRLTIGGKPASIHSFQFNYQGNTEYQVAVEELYVVSGSVLFTIHFEVMRRSFPKFRKDLKQLYDGFAVAEIDATGHPKRKARPKSSKRKDSVIVTDPTR
jgi:hypothetical protein